jgi:hypothetical protein
MRPPSVRWGLLSCCTTHFLRRGECSTQRFFIARLYFIQREPCTIPFRGKIVVNSISEKTTIGKTRYDWSRADLLLGTMPDSKLGRMSGIPTTSVYRRRSRGYEPTADAAMGTNTRTSWVRYRTKPWRGARVCRSRPRVDGAGSEGATKGAVAEWAIRTAQRLQFWALPKPHGSGAPQVYRDASVRKASSSLSGIRSQTARRYCLWVSSSILLTPA